jgi:hypothetical protein
VYVDGAAKPMPDALADPELASAISGEGPIPQLAELTAMLAPSAARISASAEPRAIAAAH